MSVHKCPPSHVPNNRRVAHPFAHLRKGGSCPNQSAGTGLPSDTTTNKKKGRGKLPGPSHQWQTPVAVIAGDVLPDPAHAHPAPRCVLPANGGLVRGVPRRAVPHTRGIPRKDAHTLRGSPTCVPTGGGR